MSADLVAIFVTPEAAILILIALYIYGLYWSIKTINEANKKDKLSDEEKKEKNTAVILLSCLIGIPTGIFLIYHYGDAVATFIKNLFHRS